MHASMLYCLRADRRGERMQPLPAYAAGAAGRTHHKTIHDLSLQS